MAWGAGVRFQLPLVSVGLALWERARGMRPFIALMHLREIAALMGIISRLAVLGTLITLLAGCSSSPTLPSATGGEGVAVAPSGEYLIGPGDGLGIFVWRNPELSVTVTVRPDGRVSIPLVEDVPAVGKTPTGLARELEDKLRPFIKDPIVTVIPSPFVGPFTTQVRVIGEAAKPQALPYRAGMTALDVMIAVGGLTKYAAGDRSVLVRTVNNKEQTFRVHLSSLIKDGEVGENVYMEPGDILIIPQSYF